MSTSVEPRPYDADELAALDDEQHFRLQHELTYRPGLDSGAYPDDALHPVGNHTPPRWSYHAPDDVDGQWSSALSKIDKGVYRTFAPMSGLDTSEMKKGSQKQVTRVPGVVFDLDTVDGFHGPAKSGLPDPTREQAREILDAFAAHGIRPTYVLDTGGGFQAVVVTDEPLGPKSKIFAAAAKALKLVCDDLAVAHDAKVTKNPACLVRVAGTRNRKTKPAEVSEKMAVGGWTEQRLSQVRDDLFDAPVRLVEVTAETMTQTDLAGSLDAVIKAHSSKPRKPAAPEPDTDGWNPGYDRHVCGSTDDPRDQVCLALPMSRIVRELDRFDFEDSDEITDEAPDEEDPAHDVKLTWSDDPDHGTSAELIWREHPDSGVMHSTVVPYGNSTSDLFGTDESLPQCSYWYLIKAHCSGEVRLAHALIHRFAPSGELDADGLFDALSACQSAEEVREAFGGLEDELKASEAKSEPVSLSDELAEALDAFDGRKIVIEQEGNETLFVRIGGGPAHGTWICESKWDPDEKEMVDKDHLVWSAVAYREGSAKYFDGDLEVTEELSGAVILDRYGRKFTTGLIPKSSAVNATSVWVSASPEGVRKPNRTNSDDISTCLMSLVAGGGSEVYQTAMGWHEVEREDGSSEWHYNGTTAGVSASGPIPGIWRKAPDVERAGGTVIVHPSRVSKCQQGVGWPVVPTGAEEIARAATVIGALRELTPTRLDIHLALLGIYFSAPLLGLAEKPAANLEAEPEHGKSKLVSCYNTFLTNLPIGSSYLTASLAVKFSVPGMDGLRRSYNDAVVVLDDAAENNDRRKNEDMRAAVDGAIKAAFGSADGPMADGDGGTRVRRASRCAVIVTSEKPLEGLGIESRALALPRMEKSDLHPEVDAVFGPAVDDGLPRQLYASYIRWLAAYLDEFGPDALRTRIYAHKNALYKRLGKNRAVDVAGSVYAGLMMLGDFLTESGCRDVLASDEEINEVMAGLTAEAKERNKEAGIGQIAVNHIAGLLATGRAVLEGTEHLSDPDAERHPTDSIAVACGWRKENNVWKALNNAPAIGFITDEDENGQRYVLITDAGLQAAWRSADRAEKHSQVRSAWRSTVSVEQFRKSDRPSVGLPGSPRRGTVFTPEAFGIAVPSFDDAAKALSDGSLPAGPPDVVDTPAPKPATEPAEVTATHKPENFNDEGREGSKQNETEPTQPKPTTTPKTAVSTSDGTDEEPRKSARKKATPKKTKEPKPLTKRQIETIAKTRPRILPDDMIYVDLG